MNYKIRLFAFCSAISFSTLIHATVGGPEKIELLGYDKVDHKIYFTRNYYDESDRPPTLYYFSLNTKSSHTPIEVKSIYKKINDEDYFMHTSKIKNEISKIQKRLTPLKCLTQAKANILVLKNRSELGHFWLNASELSITKFTQEYVVINTSFKSKNQRVISYSTPKINILNLSSTPETKSKKYQIAIIEYLGIPTEFGYMIEDAVLLESP